MLAAAPASARRVATDTGNFDPDTGIFTPPAYFNSPGCTLDGAFACQAYNLGFSVRFNGGRSNKIYLYDNGLVTFGAPNSSPFGPAAVYSNLRDDPGYYGTDFYRVAFFDKGPDYFNVRWETCASPGSNNTDCGWTGSIFLNISRNAALGLVTVSLDISDYLQEGALDSFEYLEAQYGYAIDGQEQALAPLTKDSVLSFTLRDGAGVPEPASWALLLTGFGLTGTALRRQRRLAAAA
jgi:hypothetical protein